MLLSEEADFRTRNFTRNKESHFIVINKALIHEDIMILKVYTTNNIVSIYIMHHLIYQQEVDEDSTSFSIIDRPFLIKLK